MQAISLFFQHHHPSMNPYTSTSHPSFIVDLGVWTSCRCFWTSSSHGVPPDCKRLIWQQAWNSRALLLIFLRSCHALQELHLMSFILKEFLKGWNAWNIMKHHQFRAPLKLTAFENRCQPLGVKNSFLPSNPWFSLLRSMSIALAWAPSISCMRPELIGPKYQPKNDELDSCHLWKLRSGATNRVTVLVVTELRSFDIQDICIYDLQISFQWCLFFLYWAVGLGPFLSNSKAVCQGHLWLPWLCGVAQPPTYGWMVNPYLLIFSHVCLPAPVNSRCSQILGGVLCRNGDYNACKSSLFQRYVIWVNTLLWAYHLVITLSSGRLPFLKW